MPTELQRGRQNAGSRAPSARRGAIRSHSSAEMRVSLHVYLYADWHVRWPVHERSPCVRAYRTLGNFVPGLASAVTPHNLHTVCTWST